MPGPPPQTVDLSAATEFEVSEKPTWQQLSAAKFAWAVLVVIAVGVLVSGAYLWSCSPKMPPVGAPDGEFARFKELDAIVWGHTERLFQMIVVTVLLPLLTLLLGYAFGARAGAKSE